MCGIPDATWGQAYKCTDVTSDSYTCTCSDCSTPMNASLNAQLFTGGGCVKASPFGSTSTGGVNCHKLPNVDEVSCNAGKCIVHTCKTGFTMTHNNGCVADPHAKTTRDVPIPGLKASLSGSQ